MANVVDRRENTNNWQDWVNLILAVWLFISPWVLNFAGQQRPSWDAWIVGIIVGVLSIAALTQVQDLGRMDQSFAWSVALHLAVGVGIQR